MNMLGVAVVLPWVFLGFTGWVVYQLVRQNGRVLIRLDGIEGRLAELARASAAPGVGESGPAEAEWPPPESLPLGSPAPDFELPDLRGKRRALSEFRGRRVLVMFFGPRCGYCIDSLPEIARMPADGRGGAPVPLVVTTGAVGENRKIFDGHRLRGPVLLQKDMEVASAYKAQGTPMGYLIDEAGRIASGIAVGSQALLALAKIPPQTPPAEPPAPAAGSNGKHGGKVPRGNRHVSTSRLRRDGLSRGETAPSFCLPAVAGGEVALEDFRGRPVLLVFSDPECGPCDALAPRLEEVHRRGTGPQVVVVSRRDMEANRRKVAAAGLTYPVAVQKNWDVSMLYAMFATPVGYLIDERGVLASGVAVGVEPILALAADEPDGVPAAANGTLAGACLDP